MSSATASSWCAILTAAPRASTPGTPTSTCSGGSESEARKCTAIGCALWPYRMGWNPFRAPREMTPEQREAGAARLAAARARGRSPSEQAAPAAEHSNYQGTNDPDASAEENGRLDAR